MISRRKLLESTALAGVVLAAQSKLVAAFAAGSTPRERLLLDFGWRFAFGNSSYP